MRELIRKYPLSDKAFEFIHEYEDELDEEFKSNETGHGYDCRCSMCREKEKPFSFKTQLEHNLLDEDSDLTNELYELDEILLDEEVDGEVNRKSKEYVRWVQRSLNKILGVKLVVDGKVGSKTRSTIRSFQKQYSLTVDGKMGPQTESILTMLTFSAPPSTGPTIPSSGAYGSGTLNIVNARMPSPVGDQYRFKKNATRIYGIPETIDALKWITSKWHKKHPEIRIGIGDISKKGGGKISPHKSHRIGLDADLSLNVRATNKRIGNSKRKNSRIVKNYDEFRHYARDFVDIININPFLPIKIIWFFDHSLNRLIPNSSTSRSHYRHFHIRFCRPDHRIAQLNLNKVYKKSETKGRYDCRGGQSEFYEGEGKWDDCYSDEFESEWFEEELTASALTRAVNYNRNRAKSIGWYDHYDAIVGNMLKLNYSPNEEAFAQALAEWQGKNGLDDDGKLGPDTWKKMRVVLGVSGGGKLAGPSTSRKEKIALIVETNRGAFGISKANEKVAASLWGRNKLRAISASNINKYIGSLGGFGSHISFSQALFGKTSLALYESGKDINFVMAIATREGGTRGLVRTDNAKVSSAGKDTHKAGISGLDYLYKRAKYFREVGIFIEPVPKSALVPGRENRAPAYIMAKHLMFAHMVEVARREYNTWRSDLVKVMNRKGVTGSPDDYFNDLSRNARRAWVALSYSGGGRVRAVFDFLITDQKRRGLAFDFNEIMTNPFKGLKHKYKARVMLARATSLRAHVFDQLL